MLKLYNGDCLEVMKEIPDKSVDLILCDLPYGLSHCPWDTIIPFKPLWKQYRRVLKINGTAILFGNQPFMSDLVNSNKSEYSHTWYWKKNNVTGALSAKKMPMRCIEEIAVFRCNAAGKNNVGLHQNLREYFFAELEKSGLKRKDVDKILNSSMSSHYFTRGQQFAIPSKEKYEKLQAATGCFKRPYEDIKTEYDSSSAKRGFNFTYNPQGVRKRDKPRIKVEHENNQSSVYADVKPKTYTVTMTGCPKNLLEIEGLNPRAKDRLHPTQKPVELLEYLIKTYSNEGETVLDNCMGSGSTGVAAINTNRKFIGIELDEKYFNIAESRIKLAAEQKW